MIPKLVPIGARRSAIVVVMVLFAAPWLCGCYTPSSSIALELPVKEEVWVDFNDPVLNRRKILLFGPLNDEAAERVIQKLLFLDSTGDGPIDLYLQTPGGSFKAAMAIEQTMRMIRSRVNTYALSECNSGGTMILAAGTGTRYATRGSVLMVHGLVTHGKPEKEFNDAIQASYHDFLKKRTRLPDSWLPIPPGKVYVLTAEQAEEYGLVDVVID